MVVAGLHLAIGVSLSSSRMSVVHVAVFPLGVLLSLIVRVTVWWRPPVHVRP